MTALFVAAASVVIVVATMSEADAAGGATCLGLPATHSGTEGDDVITGTNGPDVIAGLAGRDVIDGGGGDDIICGGPGGDRIDGGDGDDRIFGGLGHDLLKGGKGADTIRAGIGHDWVYGNQSTDTVHGLSGADVCIAESEKGCEMDYRGTRDVEEWRLLAEIYFGDIGQTNNALDVMDCESQGNPFAVGPGGNPPLGLFQHLESYWPGRAANAGWPGAAAFHPEANMAATRWLYDAAGGWWPSWGGCAPGY
jgi:hypothetical protein